MIYFIIFCVLIGSINTNIGINITSSIKINVTDILFIICFLWSFFIKRYKIRIFRPIKLILIMMFVMTVSMFWGIVNGAELGDSIRILRNILYIFFMFYLGYNHYKDKENINVYNDFMIFSWVAIINCFVTVTIKYLENNWFMYYRENPSFQVFMFTFLLFYKPKGKESSMRVIVRNITIILLGLCIFFSQERLQIMAICISILISLMYRLMYMIKNKKLELKVSNKKLFLFIVVGIAVLLVIRNILNIKFVQDYIEYFIRYRINSVIYNNNFISDASLNARQLQFINILNRDFIYYLIGSGLGSLYMSATGFIHIVDGVWLWIFKDMGIVGLMLLISIYMSIIIEVKKIKFNRLAIISGLLGILILQIFTPNIMLVISDSVFIGYILSIICLSKYSNVLK